jgi:pyruvate/2-oxoglutarate dehydrogenase complex dihydrolipoamide acyltransferase (E2) component
MPITIEMPKLSDTMTEGTLLRWVKKVGDNVAVGDVLAEVETDKATMEMEAFDEGTLSEVYVNDGQTVQVGQKLALLLGAGESKPADSKSADSKPSAPASKQSDAQKKPDMGVSFVTMSFPPTKIVHRPRPKLQNRLPQPRQLLYRRSLLPSRMSRFS